MMQAKLNQLSQLLRQMGSVAVAYSGGTDSAFLLKVARDTLGEAVLALTADSPSQPRAEQEAARAIAKALGVRHVVLLTPELEDPRYLANTPQRCYVCKGHILDVLMSYAQTAGFRYIVDGTNADDLSDHRPGRRAAVERGIRSPLQEVGLTKTEIRVLSREHGLPNWDKPAWPRAFLTEPPSLLKRWRKSSAPRAIFIARGSARCAYATTGRSLGWS
jgi:uncharacterized protein